MATLNLLSIYFSRENSNCLKLCGNLAQNFKISSFHQNWIFGTKMGFLPQCDKTQWLKMSQKSHFYNFSGFKIKITLLKNHPKCLTGIYQFWPFLPMYVLLKLTCLVTLFDRKLQFFKISSKLTIFGICLLNI